MTSKKQGRTTIGVISDTHGHLDPQVEKKFAGVDHILHAGDIGDAALILELQFIAQMLYELHTGALTVEVASKADEMRLDAQRATRSNGW